MLHGGDNLPGLNTSFTAIKANALANGIGTAGIMLLGPARGTAKPSGPHVSSSDKVAKGGQWVAVFFFGQKRTVSAIFSSWPGACRIDRSSSLILCDLFG